ncbi:hypothetical protein AB0J82_39080 [Asanoa sp. NPDC049518]|uniref:hypothetical protein n=1 Tax=unclassified Asanoa TaxID=2685164 RepID=UPI0034445AAD
MSFDTVIDALAAMEPSPRKERWRSLSYCVIDAVWSIANRYDDVVKPLVRRVAERNGDQRPVIDPSEPLPPDPLPLSALLERYPSTEALRYDTNDQRTSSRSGILKAEAVLLYADILVEHQVPDLASAAVMMEDRERWDEVDQALAAVRGEGKFGVRRGYLWMLCGSDHLIKPDRMILRWLDRHGCYVTPVEARNLVERAAETLTMRLHRPVTPWMVDRAIWKAERARPAVGRQTTIMFNVADWPPLKNEATSLFAARHPQRNRVESLLSAATAAATEANWVTTKEDVALDVTICSPAAQPPGDATNFLGGIADVLQGKRVSPNLDTAHLPSLDDVALFADDRQIQEIGYRVIPGQAPSYSVRITVL